MSSFMRRATAVSVLTLSVGVGTALPASGAAPPARPAAAQPTAAQAGAGWIGRQFTGRSIETGGVADPGSTAEAILAMASAGVGGRKAKVAIRWLSKNFESYVSPGGVDDAGALATVILAAQAMGKDPTAFGGKKKTNDLIARLEDSQQPSGLFGSSDPTYNGAFRQGLALMALANQKIPSTNPVMVAAVTWLQGQQCSDGGWESFRSDTSAPCDAPDASTFAGPDTNSTALAVEGLVAAGASFPVDPTGFFVQAQDPDGGFGFIGSSNPSDVQPSDPDSTGEVIQALVALGELADPAFTVVDGSTSATPVTALATFQMGCAAATADRGSYIFPGAGDGPNLLASLEAVPGAAEVAFPFSATTLTPSLPTMKCHAH